MFGYMHYLQTIKLPSGIIECSRYIFDCDSYLKNVIIYETTPPYNNGYTEGRDIFGLQYTTVRCYVPVESLEKYKQSEYWQRENIYGNYPVEFAQENLQMKVGYKKRLSSAKGTLSLSQAYLYSSNTNVVEITSDSTIYARKLGKAYIIAVSDIDDIMRDTCLVKVINIPVQFSQDELVMDVGDKQKLSSASGALDLSLTQLYSSNDDCVKVTSDGTVTALNPGEAYIIAMSNYDEETRDTCLVTVNDKSVQYIGGIYYIFGGEAAVTNRVGGAPRVDGEHSDYVGTVNIPSTVNYNGNTYNVTSIGQNAFSRMKELQSVVIPPSVKQLENNSFAESKKLARVLFTSPSTSNLNYIYKKTFLGCSQLNNIVLPDNVYTIADSAFLGCSALSKITLPKNLNMIGEYTFAQNSALHTINLPEKLASIQKSGFRSDVALESISFPAGLQGIGANCFTDCSSLKQTEFLSNISTLTVGESAFKNCNALEKVRIANLDSWAETNFYNRTANPAAYAHHLYDMGGSEITDAQLPEGTLYINNNAFTDCSNLKVIRVPSTVQFVNDNIFYGCSNLEKVLCSAEVVPPFLGVLDPSEMNDVFNHATLYVPNSSIANYKADSWWGRFYKVEDIATGINGITIDNSKKMDVYNLNGTLVTHDINKLNELPKGIYIVNGKKIVK